MKLSTPLLTAALAVAFFSFTSSAKANECSGLSVEAEKKCWEQKLNRFGMVTKKEQLRSADGCPAGQGMATWGGKKMGCMTPAQYELWNAQMQAAHRANRRPVIMPAPVAVPTVYNQHLQMQNQINHLQGCVQYGYGCGYR